MKRASGVLMHVSTLWGDYSEGAFSKSAKEFIDFLAECKFTYWQVLPFCIPDEYNSPYKSYSAFSINPYFIDIERLYDKELITRSELKEAMQGKPYACEFEKLNRERIKLLKKAASRFLQTSVLDEFYKSHPQTAKFCEFMALKSANMDKEWTEWTNFTPSKDTLHAWRFIQYMAITQWLEIKEYANKRGVKIIGDIPIYVALDSADVWANPDEFQLDKDKNPSFVAGVPPDYFSEDGQLWGNPLYDWEKMKESSFSWWKERMAFMCELFDGVRIDHFRGLESYFAIPANEKTARNGKWKKGPGMKLINELKKICGDKLVIAEDLGEITPAVERLVKASTFPGMRVLQFGLLGESNSMHLPHNYPNNCVAYTGTHDNNTLLGYVWELDKASRERFLSYFGYEDANWDNCYDTVIRSMLSSHAGLVIFPIQDLLKYGKDTRLNTPGSCDDNWSFRITKEQFKSIDREKLKAWNITYSRD
ncbi:MAG: 4-alpha-glucanotransferase [Clostridia bacterium]|nr:4-alpha-glucanotransferase [Clostridia bacterium]MBP3495631.1 4-alpha-glucanotransferase [Clostridia bacterium]MBQ7788910.1 4-alpha-glucanotransferase [Clostridia bacterium]